MRPAVLGAAGVAVAMGAASLLPETAIITLRGIPVEPIALIVALPLAWFASQVVAARDAHRFVVGLGVAVVAWFLVWYPNIAALPMPSTVVNAHQGFLPTYLYAFQFPVNTVARAPTALLTPMLALLAAAIAATALVVAYSASVWRLALAGSRTSADGGDGAAAGEGSDGLARSGGGA
jgi:hypothetical protein